MAAAAAICRSGRRPPPRGCVVALVVSVGLFLAASHDDYLGRARGAWPS